MWSDARTGEDLGAFLADLRVEHGLTQQQVADQLGIPRRYLYEVEAGKPGLFTDRLFALLRLYDARLRITGPDDAQADGAS